MERSRSDLNSLFIRPADCPAPAWFCEPKRWSVDEGALRVEPEAQSDFWQRTHYGFQADNGHFLHTEIRQDFELSVHVRFEPANQYDQAGLMIRLSPDCWLKTSVEYECDEPARLGAVVTNCGFSDWSTQDFPKEAREVWLRIRRTAGAHLVEASLDGKRWTQIRLAHLAEDDGSHPIQVGPYACSPKGSGYVALFDSILLKASAGCARK